MRIKTRHSQHRRDFRATYECEHCGHEQDGHGYDDNYFHAHVIPEMVCPQCEKKAAGQTSHPIVPEGVHL